MSQIVADKVISIGVRPSRVRILPNRIDLDIFRPILDTNCTQNIAARYPPGKHILHVGRKSPEKNIATLIKALALLPVNYDCTFIGQGDTTSYRMLAEMIGVENRCYWIDAVSNPELPYWYSWCDCMCTPSLREGFGLVFIEAAACGAPIVTSDIPPMNEYLTSDINARLVPDYEDPAQLAEAIMNVCEDTEYRNRISEGALRLASQFDKTLVDTREVEIYREALKTVDRSGWREIERILWLVASLVRTYIIQRIARRLSH